jgi:hypothetical protein
MTLYGSPVQVLECFLKTEVSVKPADHVVCELHKKVDIAARFVVVVRGSGAKHDEPPNTVRSAQVADRLAIQSHGPDMAFSWYPTMRSVDMFPPHSRRSMSCISLNPKCVADASVRRMAPWMRARDELS